MLKEIYSFEYTDSLGNAEIYVFTRDEYPNLMEYLYDKGIEEWGDCMGKAECGTCHVQLQSMLPGQEVDLKERNKLVGIHNRVDCSRLACQIYLRADLDQSVIVYLGCD